MNASEGKIFKNLPTNYNKYSILPVSNDSGIQKKNC